MTAAAHLPGVDSRGADSRGADSRGADSRGAILTIDLDAVAANWRLLRDRLGGAECAGVVKADAYGLGAERVAPVLAAAGCRTFFVAQIEEGIALRPLLPDAEIHVLNGLFPKTEILFEDYGLIPVLNSLGDLAAWRAFCAGLGRALPADLHVDTGMSRLGLPQDEMAALADDPGLLDGVDLRLVISHLACADEPDHPLNGAQLAEFRQVRRALPGGRASLANSAGVFLGPDYHHDLARPGIALYGGAPTGQGPNPMAQVIGLQGKILQVREIDTPRTVGYGATHAVAGRRKIATVPVGYADGFLRSLSNRGHGWIGGCRVPIVGRVSMDLITLDVTDAPADAARPGALVDLIGPRNPVDAVAADAGTISYEILTGLGRRYHRVHLTGRPCVGT
ncbi:MAG: alanine racemase [Hyphomicrobiales bacterium]|nr:alanine racemase [Hyphomicrobiales bacterium]MCP5373839.1 alanine racemase [Hyphomicrobiales bacterium]